MFWINIILYIMNLLIKFSRTLVLVIDCKYNYVYRSDTVNFDKFVWKILLRIKLKFELQ